MSRVNATVAWHDAQQGRYDADLAEWRRIAGGRVLELGAGTGRVSIPLALAGVDVTALDLDARLLEELQRRARAAGVEIPTIACDARHIAGDVGSFDTIIAPASFVQIVPDAGAVLAACARRLAGDGVLAVELTDLDELYGLDLPGPACTVRRGRRSYVMRLEDADYVSPGNLRCRWSRTLATRAQRHGRRRKPREMVDLVLPDAVVVYRQVSIEDELAKAGLRASPTESVDVPHTAGAVGGTIVVATRA